MLVGSEYSYLQCRRRHTTSSSLISSPLMPTWWFNTLCSLLWYMNAARDAFMQHAYSTRLRHPQSAIMMHKGSADTSAALVHHGDKWTWILRHHSLLKGFDQIVDHSPRPTAPPPHLPPSVCSVGWYLWECQRGYKAWCKSVLFTRLLPNTL